jgi:hypothetical protein
VHGRQGWLGSKDAILHSGEGPIQAIKWSGTLIAWANDLGVKVHDTSVHQRIAYIERPRSRWGPCMLLRPRTRWLVVLDALRRAMLGTQPAAEPQSLFDRAFHAP